MFKYSINKIRKYVPAIFLCYGIITAIFILKSNANTYVENQMPSRVEMMQDSLDAISGGEVPDVFSYADAQPGFYLIVSYVASVSGCTDAAMVLQNCQDVFAFILFSVLPFLVYKLFVNSMWGGVITPFVAWGIWGNVLVKTKSTPYYIMAWGTILSFFLLSLLIKETKRRNIWRLIVAESLVIGLSNFVRVGSLVVCPVLMAGILIIKLWNLSKLQTVGRHGFIKRLLSRDTVIFLLVTCFMYNFFNTGIATLVCRANGLVNMEQTPPWHSLYIGLGYGENPYGIYYSDECAIKKALESSPDAVYHTEKYFEVIKQEYFKILKDNPLWVLGIYIKKILVSILYSVVFAYSFGNKAMCILAAVLFMLLLVKDRKKIGEYIKRFWLYIFLFMGLYFGGMLQGVMAVPTSSYVQGSIAMVGMVMLITVLRFMQILEETIKHKNGIL